MVCDHVLDALTEISRVIIFAILKEQKISTCVTVSHSKIAIHVMARALVKYFSLKKFYSKCVIKAKPPKEEAKQN